MEGAGEGKKKGRGGSVVEVLVVDEVVDVEGSVVVDVVVDVVVGLVVVGVIFTDEPSFTVLFK